jgi:hypothetical protein
MIVNIKSNTPTPMSRQEKRLYWGKWFPKFVWGLGILISPQNTTLFRPKGWVVDCGWDPKICVTLEPIQPLLGEK